METDRTMSSSWNWESGETVEYLYWRSGEPNVGDNQCAFSYITTPDGRWGDWTCSDKLGNWGGSNGYGYICEKTVPTCAEFSVGSSNYKATFVIVTHFSEFKNWNELKVLCDDDYDLVSINTTEENNAILDILQGNCTNGAYAIGLSRESGSDRTMASSWNWESGETLESNSYWASGEPNTGDNLCAFGYITNSDGRWNDGSCSDKFGNFAGSNGFGYVCEKVILTTSQVTSTVLDASTDVTTHPGTTANQLMSLIPAITIANPPVTSTLEETTDVTHHGTIDNDLTITDDIRMTDCCLVNEDESTFDLTAVVISSVTLNVVFAVVIVMLLHRFHDQLFCKPESDLKTSEKSQKPANVCHVIEENAAYGGFNEDVQQPVYVEVAE